jgi:hypothetical protein
MYLVGKVFQNKFLLFLKNFPKNLIFPKEFLLNRVKKIFFDLKSWGPLKNFKSEAVHVPDTASYIRG